MDTFISQIPKRISKLESFIRQNEDKIGFKHLRYYENCVIESKGTILLGHLILTDETLFLTQNPPKSLRNVIQLSQIKDIHLVADRRTLVKAPSNHNYLCQHVRLLYCGLNTVVPVDHIINNETLNNNKTSKENWNEIESDFSSSSNEETTSSSGYTESLKICCCFEDYPDIPISIQTLYHPHSCRSSSSSSISTSSSKISSKNLGSNPFKKIQKNSQTTTYNLNKNRINSTNSPSITSQILSEESHDDDVRSSSILEQKLYSWRIKNENNIIKNNEQIIIKRPSSIDISQLTTTKFNTNKFKRIFSNTFTKNLTNKNNITKSIKSKKTNTKIIIIEEINIYLYESTSLFLNEIFLYWNRQILKSTIENDLVLLEKPERSVHAAEKEFTRLGFNQNGELNILFLSPKSKHSIWELNRLFTRLSYLHMSLRRYQHLAQLSWKSQVLVRGLLGILKSCLVPIIKNEEEEIDVTCTNTTYEFDPFILVQLSTYLIVMDIFRLLYVSCSTSSLIQQQEESLTSIETTLHGKVVLEWNQITKILLHTIFSYPNVFSKRKLISNNILKVNLYPQTFAKLEWMNGPKFKVIGLVAMCHNTSAALLYEILTVVHFSKRNIDRVSILKFLENYQMELYLRMSVTQVIHMLWPTNEQMTGSQCVLLHIHVSVLKTLLNNLPLVKTFLQLKFSEEFRYFINSRNAGKKIPDQYSIKEKLLFTCDELRNEIIS